MRALSRPRSDGNSRRHRARSYGRSLVLALLVPLVGCTPWAEYLDNGLKVGPNYHRPAARVEQAWIDASDERVSSETADLSAWWQVFSDPHLNNLIYCAYRQNLTLREAGFRVLQARALLGIAIGEFFPQQQYMAGSYSRNALSAETANNLFQFGLPNVTRFFDQWNYNFGLSWELDFWGRFRRAIESNEAALEASVFNYDAVLVTLLGDVATTYIDMRSLEQQIAYSLENVELQRETLTIVEARFRANTIGALDLHQARSTLAQTEAQVEELRIRYRQSQNRLCVLMGMPPKDLDPLVGKGTIPKAPLEVAAGIPADLLRRRPDVRRAERQAAAQSEQVGIAESDFYPHITINGNLGFAAEDLSQLVQPSAFSASIVPGFQWNLLNYGRILNNVRLQDAKLAELIVAYQNTVLIASREVEDGLVQFLRAEARVELQSKSVDEALQAAKLALVQYKAGTVDFTRVTQVELNLVQQKNTLAQAEAEFAQGLVLVYRALGGGWEIKCTGCEIMPIEAASASETSEELPAPDDSAEPSSEAAGGSEPEAEVDPAPAPPMTLQMGAPTRISTRPQEVSPRRRARPSPGRSAS